MLYARHIGRVGIEFYRLVCEQDLEGIVAKLKRGAFGEGWFKIRNPRYSRKRAAATRADTVLLPSRL